MITGKTAYENYLKISCAPPMMTLSWDDLPQHARGAWEELVNTVKTAINKEVVYTLSGEQEKAKQLLERIKVLDAQIENQNSNYKQLSKYHSTLRSDFDALIIQYNNLAKEAAQKDLEIKAYLIDIQNLKTDLTRLPISPSVMQSNSGMGTYTPTYGVPAGQSEGPLTLLNFLAKQVHDTAVSKGWYDCPECQGRGYRQGTGFCQACNEKGRIKRSFPEVIALMHSELSKALEEYRSGQVFNHIYFSNGKKGNFLKTAPNKGVECTKPEGIGIELIDCVIRIFDTCIEEGIDVDTCFQLKTEYNKGREYKHGGKKC